MQGSPSSYVARLARAAFYLSQGLEARGTEVFQDIPEESIRAMRAYLEKSSVDLERSLGLSPKPYLSHRYLMAIAQYTGSRASTKSRYTEAAKLAPASVEPRLAYMTSLEPRWGGSYRERSIPPMRSGWRHGSPLIADSKATAPRISRRRSSTSTRPSGWMKMRKACANAPTRWAS